MRKFVFAFLLSTLALAASGRLTLAADVADEAKNKDIRKMLELSGAGKMGMQIMEQMTKSFRTQMPQVPPEFWDEMMKEVKADEIVDMIVPIYAKHFSHEDIRQLIAFYESPIGKKLVAEQPSILTESMGVGQAWGQKIGARVVERLRDKGFLPKA